MTEIEVGDIGQRCAPEPVGIEFQWDWAVVCSLPQPRLLYNLATTKLGEPILKQFDSTIVHEFGAACDGTAIYFVGLGMHDFQLAFAQLHLSATERVVFSISRRSYEWIGGPNEAPVWLLVGQTPTGVSLVNPNCLRLCLTSGDFIELFSKQGPYESLVVKIGASGSETAYVF
ncbi:MAG TPA: hypothetical protein PKE20_15515 [Promineifilum sp.]|jgi:hypothetical protein|nr:hypothetical protein [Promineifilum sp.]